MAEAEEYSGEDDAARAFEELRAEVSALRAAIEQQIQASQSHAPPDYTSSLGQITKKLNQLNTQLGAIGQHPALAMTPAMHQQIIRDSGQVVMRDAVSQFNHAVQWVERNQQELAAIVGTARRRGQQSKWLLITAAVALLAGFVAAPFMARGLPIGLQSRMAAAVMGVDRWNAGSALMELESPDAWREILSAAALQHPNRDALRACRATASKTKKPQRCTVIIPAPAT